MKVSLATLKPLLLGNVAEIKFFRRRPRPGMPPTRRMLCTNSFQLLNSREGRLALNYRPPTTGPRYNPDSKGLIVTWDIIMQDYRCVSLDACELITTIPANEEFWKYFNEKLCRLSQRQKTVFMNS